MRRFLPILITFLLFVLFLPLTLQINFTQNDDWVYYRMVSNFLNTSFALDSISAPTFYTQGIIAMIFALIFGLSALPVLTLVFSVLNFYLCFLILKNYLRMDSLSSVLLGMLVFLNPLHLYSIWGFMTENYFLFFFLLSVLFYLRFRLKQSTKSLLLFYISTFLSFMLKQASLVILISAGLFCLFNKKYKESALHFGVFGLMYIFYELVFPKTPEMYEKSLQFKHILNFDYSFSLIFGSLILLASFILPLIFVGFFNQSDVLKKKSFWLLIPLIFLAIFLASNFLYKPEVISWGEFPYFENTFERAGFYPRGIDGTKYIMRFNYDLYKYWDLVSKISLVFFIVVSFYKKKIIDFWLLTAGVYLGLMLITETFYDRYLLILIPVLIFYAAESCYVKRNFISLFSILTFLIFLAFLGYQFSLDFVLSNRYVWNKSIELVKTEGVQPYQLKSTHSWNITNNVDFTNVKYEFSYDSPQLHPLPEESHTLIQKYEVQYPLNLFVNPNIYLYRNNLYNSQNL